MGKTKQTPRVPGFRKKPELWTVISILLLLAFLLFLVYPLFILIRLSVLNPDGALTLEHFVKFFSAGYYTDTIWNSLKVTIAVTVMSLLVGIPMSYFYTFYRLKGKKLIFVLSVLCCMSAPFLGAYSWIMLLGRNGVITKFLSNFLGVKIGSIYGFDGILLVQTLKFFPLVFIYMNGALKNIDNTLMEASASMGCTGIKRLFSVVTRLVMPTMLAAALLVFMRAFADFGTPMVIGEGYTTFPVLIYNQYVGETGADYAFAAAISVIAIIITTAVFLVQKWATNKFDFSLNALHPVDPKKPKGLSGLLMHLYCYLVCALAFLPQMYIIYLSFRNCTGAVFKEGYSLGNYRAAANQLLGRSIRNTVVLGGGGLVLIIVISVLIAYLVVRRRSLLNDTLDTLSMVPYIMPGVVIGIALLTAFGKPPIILTGSITIMLIALVIRRMPYTIRSATASLMQIPISMEEAAISLGASKTKTFLRITVPMMSPGIISGAILSWVAIITEVSSAIILYNNKTITLTMSLYLAIYRGKDGMAAAFASIVTVVTIISLLIYLKVSKSEDIKL